MAVIPEHRTPLSSRRPYDVPPNGGARGRAVKTEAGKLPSRRTTKRTPRLTVNFARRLNRWCHKAHFAVSRDVFSILINSKESINSIMILPQVHLRKPCYDFYFL